MPITTSMLVVVGFIPNIIFAAEIHCIHCLPSRNHQRTRFSLAWRIPKKAIDSADGPDVHGVLITLNHY